MAKKTTKKDERVKASQASREETQAPELIEKGRGEELHSIFLDVTGKRPVVSLGATAESLYGIKDDCCDVPRLLKAILDELIARRA